MPDETTAVPADLTLCCDQLDLSTSASDLGSKPTYFDAILERNTDLIANAESSSDMSVSDENILNANINLQTRNLLMGHDIHGTPVILGTVSNLCYLCFLCMFM